MELDVSFPVRVTGRVGVQGEEGKGFGETVSVLQQMLSQRGTITYTGAEER